MSKASANFTIGNLSGISDIKQIKKELDRISGIISVSVNDKKNSIAVDFDTTGTETVEIKKRLSDIGYEVYNSRTENHVM